MDRDIRKQNMIPGSCEEFTRPEEIQALNRYLKDLREAYDDNLTINEDNLEVTGRKFLETPQNLPDKIEVLNPGKGEVSSLVSSKEWLDNDKSLSGLSTKKEGLNGNNDVASLRQTRQDLKGKNESGSLENSKETLKGKKDIKTLESQKSKIGGDTDGLSHLETNRRETIEGLNQILGLGNTRERLGGELREEALSRTLEGLGIRLENSKLSDHKETLEKEERNLELSDFIDELGKDKNIESLRGNKEILGVKENKIRLGEGKEKLKNTDLNEPEYLSRRTEELQGDKKEQKILSQERERLIDRREDNELEKGNEQIPGGPIVGVMNLPENKERIGISVPEESLTNHLEKIGVEEKSPILEDHIEKVKDQREEIEVLNKYREDLRHKDNPTLEEYQEKIKTINKDPELETKREDLSDSRKTELSNKVERIKDENEIGLENKIETLSTKKPMDELPEHVEHIYGKFEEPEELRHLLDKKEDLRGVKETEELGTTAKTIPGDTDEIKSLNKEKEILVDKREQIELEETNNKLPGELKKENLSGHLETIKVENEDPALGKKKEGLNVGEGVGSLEDNVETIRVGEGINELNKRKETLGGQLVEPTLNETVEHLRTETSSLDELGKHVESLDAASSTVISNLPEDKEMIQGTSDNTSLTDIKETVPGEVASPTLSEHVEGLGGTPNDKLTLSDHRENIDTSAAKVDALGDKREQIIGEPLETETLVDYKENITDTRDTELEDTRLDISDERDTNLEDTKVTISDQREPELEDYKDNLEDSREPALEDYRESLSDSRDTSLEDTKITIEDSRENSLVDYKENITDTRDTELEDTRLDISDERDLSLYDETTSRNLDGNTIPDSTDEELYDETTKIAPSGNDPEEFLHTENTSKNLEGNTIPDTLDEELYTSETSKELEGNMIPDTLDETLEDYIDSLDDYRDNPELHTKDTSRELEMNKISDTLDEVLYTKDETVGTENLGYQLDTNSDSGNNAISAYNVGDSGGDSDLTDLSTRQDNVTWKGNTVERVGDDTGKQNADAFGSRTGEWSEDVGLYDAILSPENIDPDSYNQGGDKELHTSADSRELEMNMIPDTLDEELYDESTKIQPDGEDSEEFLHTEDSSVGISIDGIDINKIDDTLDEELYDDSTKISPDGEDPEEELYTEDTSKELEGNKISDTLDEELYDDSTKINPTEFGEDPDEELYEEGTSRDLNTIDDTLDEDLEDFVDTIEDDRDTKLYGSETKITPDEPTKENADTDKQHEKWTEDAGLYDSTLQVTPDKAEEVWQTALETHKETIASKNEIKDVGPGQWKEDIIENEHEETESLEDQVENVLNSTNSESEIDELKNILNSRDDLNLYYTNILKFAQNKNLNKGWASKVTGLMSAYLSGGEVSQGRAQQFEEALYKTIIQDEQVKIKRDSFLEDGKGERYNKNETSALDDHTEEMKSYELPGFNLMGNGCDPSSYLRWVAENTVGKTHGKLRAILLDETLGLLVLARDTAEKLIHANRDRLPGNDVLSQLTSGGLSLGGIAKSAVKAGAKALFGGGGPDMTLPVNRPKKNKETKEWEALSDKRLDPEEEKQTSIDFKSRYILDSGKFKGMATTLQELGGVMTVNSVDELYSVLRASPYITTAGNVTSGEYNPLKVQTLDTNQFWEIVFTPFVGTENGNVSYLPPITEINTWNEVYHGVKTGYSTWIPITGFELSKAKLTSKTLPLFDGEISYPISMEFTNEFRLTIADDQFKSWRTYFERCMDASIYNSELHKPGDYKDDYEEIEFSNLSDYEYEENGLLGNVVSAAKAVASKFKKKASSLSGGLGGGKKGKLTAIDKKYQCVAPYKNITFRCTIYSMTPQFSTVSKYDLLLVMKDFVEERSGEIDGEPGDLTVMFSIVGENPQDDRPTFNSKYKDWKTKKTKDTKRSDAASIIASGVNSVIGVL